MLTYQDYEAAANRPDFIARLIAEHKQSEIYTTALLADEYDRQRNTTARQFAALLAARGKDVEAARFTLRVTSNYFRRFNLNRCSYLLGNGVSFGQRQPVRDEATGLVKTVDVIKERLGKRFDQQLYKWGYKALIHGEAFGYWDGDNLSVFPVTGFAPLWDENTGALRAGARFWQLDADHPMIVELYAEDGITDYRSESRTSAHLVAVSEAQRPYKLTIRSTEARGAWVVGGENWSSLPVIPMYGSDLRQSTLTGLQGSIDAHDLLMSGLANDMREVAAIYWILSNQNGMKQDELDKVLEDILTHKIINVEGTSFDGSVREAMSPYTTEVPHQGRLAYLAALEKGMYQGFGALDVDAIGAGSTNDHIDAVYQALDDEADQFEMCVIDAVQQLIALEGFDDETPKFRRNRTQNITEITNALVNMAQYLDIQTILEYSPLLTVDEPETVMQRRALEEADRLTAPKAPGEAE